MNRLLPALVLLALAGCAELPEDDADSAEATATSATALTVPGITLPKGAIDPKPLLPKMPPIVFEPLVPKACSTPPTRFAVLTRSCAPLAGPGGSFSARPVFTSKEGTLCEMRWHPDRILNVAPAPYATLAAIAEIETAGGLPDREAIVPLCDATPVCNAANTSCLERTDFVPPVRIVLPIDGMGGCSSCAFVQDSTLYAVLPAEYVNGRVAIDVGGTPIYVQPAGAQTFMVDVSRVPSRRSGFALVSRY